LLKAFLISTGDDPEGDEKVDKEEAAWLPPMVRSRSPVRQSGVQRRQELGHHHDPGQSASPAWRGTPV
jgi:hypothetical protein